MKLSKLIHYTPSNAYLLGNIFAFKYEDKGRYFSVFSGKNQASTGHVIQVEDFRDIIKRADAYYGTNNQQMYSKISSEKDIPKNLKSQTGIFAEIEIDTAQEIDFIIFDLLRSENSKEFAQNFMRGLIDARSSGDTSTQYIAMDIKKKESISFSTIAIKAMDLIFKGKKQYNLNPRFNKPGKITRMKNPQFRIPYTVVFGGIGTFKKIFLDKAKSNTSVWLKLKINTNIPKTLEDLIMWDTSNYPYNPRTGSKNLNLLEGDVEYLANYSKDTEGLLYKKLKQKFAPEYQLKKQNKRLTIDYSVIQGVLKKYNYKDFLEPNKEIEINKKGEPLVDIHHMIPHAYSHLFTHKKVIDSPKNLIPLRQDTHYYLHRGAFTEKKTKYLKVLYKELEPFLIEQGVQNEITFEIFKTMY